METRGNYMKDLPNVTICGSGSAGTAMAADISLLGCKVNLYELPDFEDNLKPIQEHHGIELTGNTCSGKTGWASLNRITSNAEEATEDVELIMITVPAFGHEAFFETLSPYLVEGQTILVNTGYWASLRVKELLKSRGVLEKVTVAEEHIMPYLSRKVGPAHAHIYNFKRDIRMSAWPATKNDAAYEVVRKVYPQISLSKNVIENNFYPGNPSIHAQITIPKAAFFFERAREFKFYSEVSLCASKLSDAFDKERMKVAAALGCNVPHGFEWVQRAYAYRGQDLYEIFGSVTCEHAKRWDNDAGNRRVLREDLCYFFVPMEQLAEVLGINIPVTTAMIEILKIFTDFDYRSDGVTLKHLGMEGFTTKDEIVNYVTYGEAT
jgi:opine dehydrogenase